MNRFGSYLAAQKLAKLHLDHAVMAWNKEHEDTFKHNMVAAVREMMVANANLASMLFEGKRKGRKKS